MSDIKLKALCSTCGSTSISAEVTVEWDEERQEWSAAGHDINEESIWCADCQAETTVTWETIKE